MDQTCLDRMLKRSLFFLDISLGNAFKMQTLPDSIDGGVAIQWKKATIDVDGKLTSYWYRDSLECVHCLVGQSAFKDDMQ